MNTLFEIKFKDGPRAPNMGRRGAPPPNAVKVQHKDGTTLLLNPVTYNTAVELLLLNCKFNKSAKDRKYIAWSYIEHILDFDDENMFRLVMADFDDWVEIITGQPG